jgi:serine/threonine protein kinase
MRMLATIDEYLAVIRKSGMVDSQWLDTFLEQLQATNSLPVKPKKLARLLVREGLLTCFRAEQLLLGKWRGFVVGKYRVIERIGIGGMGIVYLCEHMTMRRWVAVKVLSTDLAEDPWSRDRFYREARAAAALDHPNIVRAHDFDQDGNLQFLVMEYVDGASLERIVQKHGRMNLLRAVDYVRQAALGLQHAHEAGVAHRDIKPGNLLLDRRGVIKILDMGLARFYQDQTESTAAPTDQHRMLGTADYLAPEQAINYHDVDSRADIYSLGATFYFLLAGRPPFAERSLAQKLIAHQTRTAQPIREIRPRVPEKLEAILFKMMAKAPADRYQTPQEIADALGAWIHKSVPAPPEAEMPRLSPAALGIARAGDQGLPSMLSTAPGGPRRGVPGYAPSAPGLASDAPTDGDEVRQEEPAALTATLHDTAHDDDAVLRVFSTSPPEPTEDGALLSWEEIIEEAMSAPERVQPEPTSAAPLLSPLAARCGSVGTLAPRVNGRAHRADLGLSPLAARCEGLASE